MTDFTPSLADYPFQITLTTRWQDNDAHGHINNVTYYSFFDTAVTRFLLDKCQITRYSQVTPFVVSSQCQYIAPAAYPEDIYVGVRVTKIGRSSVTYGISVYAGDNRRRVAHGQFVHVFIEKATEKAVPIPSGIREVMDVILEDF